MDPLSPKRKWNEDDIRKSRLMELEAIIHEHLGSGKFFLVGNFYFILIMYYNSCTLTLP